MTKQILRRELIRKRVGNKEIIENEYYEIDNFLKEDELNTIIDKFGDYDNPYDYGIWFNEDNELYLIEIDKFLEWLENELRDIEEEYPEEDDRMSDYQILKNIKKTIEDYKGFDIAV